LEFAGGTGQIITKLKNDEIDVAMSVFPDPQRRSELTSSAYFTSALTDALISGIANGSTAYKLVGSYVSSPLNWYAHPTLLCIIHVELPTLT
jgi:hypothetical protein